MRTRILSKPGTQTFVKRLRLCGYTVDRVPSGYVCHNDLASGGTELVFQAMQGYRGYLCRINDEYVTFESDQMAVV